MKRLFLTMSILAIGSIALFLPSPSDGQSTSKPADATTTTDQPANEATRARKLIARTAETLNLLETTQITLAVMEDGTLGEGLATFLPLLGIDVRYGASDTADVPLSAFEGVMEAATALRLLCSSAGARYDVVGGSVVVMDAMSGDAVPKVTISYDVVSLLEMLARRQASIDRAASQDPKSAAPLTSEEEARVAPHVFLDDMLSTLMVEYSDGMSSFSLTGYGGVLVLRTTPSMHVFCSGILADLRHTTGLDK